MLFAAFGSWNLRVCKPFAAFWSWNLSLWMLFATLYIWNFPFRMLFAAFGGWNQRYLQHFWTSTFHFAWQLSFWLIIEALWNLNLSPAHLHHCFYSTQKNKREKTKARNGKRNPRVSPTARKKSCQTCNEWSMFIARPFLLGWACKAQFAITAQTLH